MLVFYSGYRFLEEMGKRLIELRKLFDGVFRLKIIDLLLKKGKEIEINRNVSRGQGFGVFSILRGVGIGSKVNGC